MSRQSKSNWWLNKYLRSSSNRKASKKYRLPRIESLDERITPAINAIFALGTLTVTGDNQDNNIEISRTAAGDLVINGGTVNIRGKSTVVNTRSIVLSGLGGNDTLKLDEANGLLPRASIYGGTGNDTLIGGSSNDFLFGQAGNDNLQGKSGADQLFGGANDDLLSGGDGDDQVYGEGGNDRLNWTPGDDTDFNEGGSGVDTVEVNGGNDSEAYTATADGTRVRLDRIDPTPFFISIGTSELLVLNANGGDDNFAATGNLASLISITVDGGTGNDTLRGSNGKDLLIGGEGNDFVDGQQGEDTVFLGPNDDVFQWDPGDGSDLVEGQEGNDTLQFNGSAANENFDIASNGTRIRFSRNIGNIVLDMEGFERVDLSALGGADTASVNDVSQTSLVSINIALAGPSGTSGDSQPDTVSVIGTHENDIIDLSGSGNGLSIIGLSARVNVSGTERANDTVVINSLSGNDGLTASLLSAEIVKLVLDGGAGNDVILGSQGVDTIMGGDGNDQVKGLQGDDLIMMGAGDDLVQWSSGDGSDFLEGGDGADKLFFSGSDDNENIDISANLGRVLIHRNVSGALLDLDNVEFVELRALGGVDNFVVGHLMGTDVTRLELDLRGSNGGGDGQTDAVTVVGSQGDDSIGVGGDSGGLNITGLSAEVHIFQQEYANDRLTVTALAGADTVSALSLKPGTIQLSINGGLGIDTLIGGDSDESFNGGDGNDVINMGAGDDTVVWNPGDDDDSIDGQSGFDKMIFNGSNVAESIVLSASGERVQLARDIANIRLELNKLERLDLQTFGGADVVTVNDLTGTSVVEVNLELSVFGSGDTAVDSLIINGTSDEDSIVATGDNTAVSIFGLSAQVNATGFESVNDRLVINALEGDDIVDASGLQATALLLTVDGGVGDDVLVGGDGADALFGHEGDDILIGGPGVDVLDGGTGNNILIPD